MLTDEMKAQGWVEHDGGPCPVPLDSHPEVLFRDGFRPSAKSRVRAGDWRHRGGSWWEHEIIERDCDIIAYKVEQPND